MNLIHILKFIQGEHDVMCGCEAGCHSISNFLRKILKRLYDLRFSHILFLIYRVFEFLHEFLSFEYKFVFIF